MAPCQVNVEIEGDIAYIVLTGTLVYEDVLLASTEVANVLAQGCRKIVIDMSKLVYVNSKGLGALISIQHQTVMVTAQLILLKPQPKAEKLLKLTKLHDIFRICYGTLEEAKALFHVVTKKQ